jgi:hypothetical protein
MSDGRRLNVNRKPTHVIYLHGKPTGLYRLLMINRKTPIPATNSMAKQAKQTLIIEAPWNEIEHPVGSLPSPPGPVFVPRTRYRGAATDGGTIEYVFEPVNRIPLRSGAPRGTEERAKVAK